MSDFLQLASAGSQALWNWETHPELLIKQTQKHPENILYTALLAVGVGVPAWFLIPAASAEIAIGTTAAGAAAAGGAGVGAAGGAGIGAGGALIASQAIQGGTKLGLGAMILDYAKNNPLIVLGGIGIISYLLFGRKK